MTLVLHARAASLLRKLQNEIQAGLIHARSQHAERFSRIAAVTAADTIFHIDRLSEAMIVAWLEEHWPKAWPLQVVMEGIEDEHPLTFPTGIPVEKTLWKLILDPIDGTREIMYDKRSAWTLAGLAPQRGPKTSVRDIVVAAMTELPTSKQRRADQFWAWKGSGLRAESLDLATGRRSRLTTRRSTATHFEQGFSSVAKFLPEGKALLSTFEEALWAALSSSGKRASKEGRAALPPVFDDQYLSTGGQIYEILAGHYRLVADVRPLAFDTLGLDNPLVCHPYDVCTSLLVTEAGGSIESPDGKPLDVPLNTTHPVSLMIYANPTLARKARPVVKKLIRKFFT